MPGAEYAGGTYLGEYVGSTIGPVLVSGGHLILRGEIRSRQILRGSNVLSSASGSLRTTSTGGENICPGTP